MRRKGLFKGAVALAICAVLLFAASIVCAIIANNNQDLKALEASIRSTGYFGKDFHLTEQLLTGEQEMGYRASDGTNISLRDVLTSLGAGDPAKTFVKNRALLAAARVCRVIAVSLLVIAAVMVFLSLFDKLKLFGQGHRGVAADAPFGDDDGSDDPFSGGGSGSNDW